MLATQQFYYIIFLYIGQMYVYPGVTSLMAAAQKGHTEIVMILLENGADVNIQKNDGQFPNLFQLYLSIYLLTLYQNIGIG